jgi:putative ABC transport system permease protein
MVTAISGFIASFQDLLYRDSVLRDGLWHVHYMALDKETADAVVLEPIFESYTSWENEDGITLELVFNTLDRKTFERSEAVCFKHNIGIEQVKYNRNLLIAEGIIPGGYYESLYTLAGILLSLVAIASVMVISNAFSISASERSRQFGLLKSIGATRTQIKKIVLWEGLALGMFAIPLGILVGVFAQWIALYLANTIMATIDGINFLVTFRVVMKVSIVLLAIFAALVTIMLAAWRPAARAARQSAIDAIRQTNEVSVKQKNVRVSPLAYRIFGFEGLLAAKTMKRYRRRYRTTIVSLVVSIVLFIAVGSFGDMLFKSSSMIYEDYGSNCLVQLYGDDEQNQNRLAAEIAKISDAQIYPHRVATGQINFTEEYMTANGLKMLGTGEKNINLYSLSDKSFESICREMGLSEDDFADGNTPKGILLNTSGTYIRQGRRHNFTPFKSLTGESLTFSINDESHNITVLGEIKEIPTELLLFYSANALNLIIPDNVRKDLVPEGNSSTLNLIAMAQDPKAFEEQAKNYLSSELLESDYYIVNYDEMAANNKNIWLLIMIFVYGFIAMITLISVTNVITTVSTGIALRKREFAVLSSLGMTQKDMLKSLCYESLIYGFKALLYSVPLGVLMSFLMYQALDISMSFEYAWPVRDILISVFGVLIITVLTMLFAAGRKNKQSIASMLSDEIL